MNVQMRMTSDVNRCAHWLMENRDNNNKTIELEYCTNDYSILMLNVSMLTDNSRLLGRSVCSALCFCKIQQAKCFFFFFYSWRHQGFSITFLYICALKALFNNVFTLKNLSCMALHAISVFDQVYKWSPEKNCTSKASLSASKEWK